jgi:hypothetical protein
VLADTLRRMEPIASEKPWTLDTCVQINRWHEYRFESYADALILPEAEIRQIDSHRDLGTRFFLYIPVLSSETGTWYDCDGDHSYECREMCGAQLDFYGSIVEVTGFVEEKDSDNDVFGHTGIFKPEKWSQYPHGYFDREDED